MAEFDALLTALVFHGPKQTPLTSPYHLSASSWTLIPRSLQAWELAYFGANVLHPRTTQPAMKYEIPITLRNFFNLDAPGELPFLQLLACISRPVIVMCGFEWSAVTCWCICAVSHLRGGQQDPSGSGERE